MEIRKFKPETKHDEQAALTRKLIGACLKYYGTEGFEKSLIFDGMDSIREGIEAEYGNSGLPLMSDHEYDAELEQLMDMERRSGYMYEGSPTCHVVDVLSNALERSTHEKPALSLDKIKYAEREEGFRDFGDQLPDETDYVLTYKLDGMTLVLTYENGRLDKAVTRGQNGIAGNIVTHNAVFFKGVPLNIPDRRHIVIRGEALMTFSDFERLNAENAGLYENARNVVPGTVLDPDSKKSRKKPITFKAFELVSPEKTSDGTERMYDRLELMNRWGFDVVEHRVVAKDALMDAIEEEKERVKTLDYPTDGLVVTFNDLTQAWALGGVQHHPKHSVAMKWEDTTSDPTTVTGIDWSVGRTGVITPVAVFDPVRLGIGSTVRRASLANISVAENTPGFDGGEPCTCGIGSVVTVYLANMIIPKIANATPGVLTPPETCPVCGAKTVLRENNGTKVLVCPNKNCSAKSLKRLAVFASRSGADIDGLSEKTLGELTDMGLVTHPLDLYRLKDAETVKNGTLAAMDGWGERSVANLLDAIEKSRTISFAHFLYALAIPLLGHDLSRKLDRVFMSDIKKFLAFMEDTDSIDLASEEGIGPVKSGNLTAWIEEVMEDPGRKKQFLDLVNELTFREPEKTAPTETPSGLEPVAGKTFVITGNVAIYKNRGEFKASVEGRGGKVSGSVSKKTTALVNNDAASSSEKNRKAKELGIPVLTEQEFIDRFGK